MPRGILERAGFASFRLLKANRPEISPGFRNPDSPLARDAEFRGRNVAFSKQALPNAQRHQAEYLRLAALRYQSQALKSPARFMSAGSAPRFNIN
jgi:hypothetical protein